MTILYSINPYSCSFSGWLFLGEKRRRFGGPYRIHSFLDSEQASSSTSISKEKTEPYSKFDTRRCRCDWHNVGTGWECWLLYRRTPHESYISVSWRVTQKRHTAYRDLRPVPALVPTSRTIGNDMILFYIKTLRWRSLEHSATCCITAFASLMYSNSLVRNTKHLGRNFFVHACLLN